MCVHACASEGLGCVILSLWEGDYFTCEVSAAIPLQQQPMCGCSSLLAVASSRLTCMLSDAHKSD